MEWWVEGARYKWREWVIWPGPDNTWDAYKYNTVRLYSFGQCPYLRNFATREEAMQWCETMEAVGA